jgi:hypothetical protein
MPLFSELIPVLLPDDMRGKKLIYVKTHKNVNFMKCFLELGQFSGIRFSEGRFMRRRGSSLAF